MTGSACSRVPLGRTTGRVVGMLAGALIIVASLASAAEAYPRPGATERVSVSSTGVAAGTLSSSAPAISSDGRYVAFGSIAANLVPNDENNREDVFVRDRVSGITERVSVDSARGEANGASSRPSLSADGRFVAFLSEASDLVGGDGNAVADVFVHDRATASTELVSAGPDGVNGNAAATGAPAISADGRYVAFAGAASNLIAGDRNARTDVFVFDRVARVTARVSVGPAGVEADDASRAPAISADGRYVAFLSLASNLAPGEGGEAEEIFVHDRAAGTTEQVSPASDPTVLIGWSPPAISADGRYVAFIFHALGISHTYVPGSTVHPQRRDVYVHDRANDRLERVSVSSAGAPADASSSQPAISADGRYVSFTSGASNLVSNDNNGFDPQEIERNGSDVFVHDRVVHVTERVSVGADGADADAPSGNATMSADGRHIAFVSNASNLVAGPSGGIFVRERGPRTGAGAVNTIKADGKVHAAGWARMAGAVLGSVADDPRDGAPLGPVKAGDLGAEITGARFIYRPEEEDLLFRLELSSLPPAPAAGQPGVLYRWRFRVAGTNYEIRATPGTILPWASPRLVLYRCAPACGEAAVLRGGIGTTWPHPTMSVAVPVVAVGATEGDAIGSLSASTAVGGEAQDPVAEVDGVALPNVTLPISDLDLGIAPASTPEHKVAYSVQAGLFSGRFVGSIPITSLAAGTYRVWARACLDAVCGALATEVKV